MPGQTTHRGVSLSQILSEVALIINVAPYEIYQELHAKVHHIALLQLVLTLSGVDNIDYISFRNARWLVD